jgi:D-ribose pyranase
MKHTGIINAELMYELTLLGHKDLFLIVDAGFPIPKGVARIDLAVTLGHPDFESVFSAILKEIVVETLIVAKETKEVSPGVYDLFSSTAPLEFISHEALKALAKQSVFIVRTGEATPYANVAIRCGVAF